MINQKPSMTFFLSRNNVNKSADETEKEIAFEQCVQEYWSRIYRVLYRLTGDPDKAEDLTLETFWSLWQKPPPEKQNVGGWLYRVAVNLGYNELRSQKRRQHYKNKISDIEKMHHVSADPKFEFEREEERFLVRKILSKMKPRQAKILFLRYSGLSYKEIAEIMDIPVVSIGKMLSRAEKEFEKLILEVKNHAYK